MRKIFTSFITLIFLSIPVGAEEGEWVEWLADAEISYTSIDNLNFSAFSDDTHSDERFALNMLFGRIYQFNGFTRMSLAIELAADKYQQFELMDSTLIGANLGVRHKFGLGFYQPYLQVNASYRHQEVDYDVYSTDAYNAILEFGQHINNQLSLAVSFDFTATSGKPGDVLPNLDLPSDVFDQSYFHFALFADYILSQDWLISANYAYRQGDFNSSCSGPNLAKVLEVEQVKAITKDEIFGGCVYKLDGNSNIVSASLSYSLTSHAGVNFVIEHNRGQADVLDYKNTSYLLSFNYRY